MASIKTMRRWGISWKTIIKCLIGMHGNIWDGRCARCGHVLHHFGKDRYDSEADAKECLYYVKYMKGEAAAIEAALPIAKSNAEFLRGLLNTTMAGTAMEIVRNDKEATDCYK
jgi:hypothetical protein